MKNKKVSKLFIAILTLAVSYILLLIPTEEIPSLSSGPQRPFIWNLDSLWMNLETEFKTASIDGCDKVTPKLDSLFLQSDSLLSQISAQKLEPSDKRFALLENNIFKTATLIPTCGQYFPKYIDFYSSLRNSVKEQSIHWDLNSREAKNTLYRLLYGNRTAIEEVMLQLPKNQVSALINGIDEPSETPSGKLLGLDLHSGDILVSRGGAPTSALIARGNDYPGNFSHIALVHVSSETNLISIIESHIEVGVVISSLKEYLNDKKLRIMVLRMRSELIKDKPLLPHLAAEFAYQQTTENHIPYDFEMNFNESDKLFCSEVASSAYREFGVKLWTDLSTISTIGARNWLAAFGVKYFETQEPADLEYDPQLSVVAEWRDAETLYKDHMDNAVTDIMLEEAENGRMLSYDWYILPIGRVMKYYSLILNMFGLEGPVPEGMSAEAALKNVDYSDRHDAINKELILLADKFENKNGYKPPYWELVKLARSASLQIP
ncbi:MAG: hypothetical protein K9J12_17405 [Melioribacteraceae bacterium]|nr:hypothetical protein [Melioribacteraceae bacterium]MCF8263469.1 hypothetical protein [Melioribacteraceae bacterium]MCF8431265.1 hypothetical protein [Melioribacteraceae bacterium]